MKRSLSFLVALLIFLVPSNLFYVLSSQNAYVRGILVDYLIPKVYLADVVLLCIFLATIFVSGVSRPTLQRSTILQWSIGLVTALVVLLQLQNQNSSAAIFYIWQISKIIVLYFCLRKVTFVYKSGLVRWAFSVTVIFQSCIGLYQFINQKSLSGYLLLGEPQLVQTLGLAREVVWGAERVLPYGTTAHPNILGGILAAYLIVLISQLHHFTQRKWWQKGIYFAAIVLGGVTIWTTHSLSAWAAALLGIGLASYSLWRGSKPPTIPLALAILIGITISLVTPILLAQYANVPSSIASSSIERRVILQEAAINMLTAKPLTGVGLNHFTMVLEDTMPSRETIRFIQPVHSVLLLWMAETGGVGLLLLLLLTLLAWQKRLSVPISIVAILPLAVVDHYLLTLQSGLLLTVIFVMYVQRSETSDT